MIDYDTLKSEYCATLSCLEKEIFGDDAWSEDDFRETMCCDYAYYLVAREGDLVVGCAGLRNMCGDADITNVFVRKEYRRRGIAEEMLKKLMEDSKKIGARNFTLEVRSSNTAAISLYEKLGFVLEGVRPGFYDHPKEDARIYWIRNN
ncbi:MAG: ribosomal protein S18-alanine N-acetyltransferase [Lachnospiraceae bacterium]|nr:ribosomal protein S18-alanine N-acetyltransferase [Lachnospiraceae bacterium]